MPQITNPLFVRLFINCGGFGHSENFALNTWDWNTGLAYAQLLATARSMILSSDSWIEWAVVAGAFPPYAEQAAITFVLTGQPQFGISGHPFVGLLWRFTTADGRWSNHIFKALDRTFVVERQPVNVPHTLPPGIWPLPTPLASATTTDLFLNCMTTFRDLTARCDLIGTDTFGNKVYDLTPWEMCTLRQGSSRASSHLWRRVSWEPGVYANAPGYAVCGQVTGVLHECYFAPVRWYQDGSPQSIHYYWSLPLANVFPLPHIFWGRARAKQISNVTGTGEITGAFRRTYSNGLQLGHGIGDHYYGTPADFLGQSFLPWSPETPTPAGFLQACDLPLVTAGNGIAMGGVSRLLGMLPIAGGIAFGGTGSRLGSLPSFGGLALGGPGDVVLIVTGGGLAVGGIGGEMAMIPVAGGLALGGSAIGAENLLSLLEREGGIAMGGVADLVELQRSVGGLALGGSEDSLSPLQSPGGLSVGGSEDGIDLLSSEGGLSAGGSGEPLELLTSVGGLALGGVGDTLQMRDGQGGLALGGSANGRVIAIPSSAGGLSLGGVRDTFLVTPSARIAVAGASPIASSLIPAAGRMGASAGVVASSVVAASAKTDDTTTPVKTVASSLYSAAAGLKGRFTVLLSDTFTGTNGTALTSHTMDVGSGWSSLGGTWTIQSNQASNSNNGGSGGLNCVLLANAGSSVVNAGTTGSVQVTTAASGGCNGAIWCWVDSSGANGYIFLLDTVGQVVILQNSGGTNLQSKSVTLLASTTYTLSITWDGTKFLCSLNGSQQFTYTPGVAPTNSYFGPREFRSTGTYPSGCKFDNFMVYN